MFNFIEPGEHHLYKDRILAFLERISDNSNLYDIFEDWDQAIFLLANDMVKDIRGGALLLKQDKEMLHPRIQEYLRLAYPTLKNVWTGMISLQVDEDISGRDFERAVKFFYCGLMADLVAFGVKEGTPFLCVTMTNAEYRTIEMNNLWPYAKEVRAELSKDGLFHGVLTLVDLNKDTWPTDVDLEMPKFLKLKQKKVTVH